MKSFPQPLTAAEEQYYLQKYTEGDQEAKHILIERNMRLVAHIVRKYQSMDEETEDLLSIGTIGLIKGVVTFNPDKAVRLGTYAARCIENEILMFLRKSQSSKNEVSIDEPLNIDWDGNELLLSDVLGTESDSVNIGIEHDVEKNLLLEAVNRLGERERTIMQLRFGLINGNEHTQKEVADMIGISQSYISRLEKKIIKRLKRDLEKSI